MKFFGCVTVGQAAERLPQVRMPVPKLLNSVTTPTSLSRFTSLCGSLIMAESWRSTPTMPFTSVLDGLHQ